MFSDGSTAEFTLGGLPCPQLARDLLAGLAELVHPHGSIDAAGPVDQYIPAFREMARGLAAPGFTGGPPTCAGRDLVEYWMGDTEVRRRHATRRMPGGVRRRNGRRC